MHLPLAALPLQILRAAALPLQILRALEAPFRALALLVPLMLAGCPEGGKPPVTICIKAFERCQLPEGPLGVCQETSCAAGTPAPCLRCVSQH